MQIHLPTTATVPVRSNARPLAIHSRSLSPKLSRQPLVAAGYKSRKAGGHAHRHPAAMLTQLDEVAATRLQTSDHRSSKKALAVPLSSHRAVGLSRLATGNQTWSADSERPAGRGIRRSCVAA